MEDVKNFLLALIAVVLVMIIGFFIYKADNTPPAQHRLLTPPFKHGSTRSKHGYRNSPARSTRTTRPFWRHPRRRPPEPHDRLRHKVWSSSSVPPMCAQDQPLPTKSSALWSKGRPFPARFPRKAAGIKSAVWRAINKDGSQANWSQTGTNQATGSAVPNPSQP